MRIRIGCFGVGALAFQQCPLCLMQGSLEDFVAIARRVFLQLLEGINEIKLLTIKRPNIYEYSRSSPGDYTRKRPEL